MVVLKICVWTPFNEGNLDLAAMGVAGKGDVPIVVLQFQKMVWIVVEKEVVDVFTRFVDERKATLRVGTALPIVLHASDDDTLSVNDKRLGLVLEKRDVRFGKKFED